MGPEPTNDWGAGPSGDFERELHMALERRPAPPSLKGKIQERRRRQNTERLRRRLAFFERLAAGIVLAGALSGGFLWHRVSEQRKGEQARAQVLTALRIASHALNAMSAQFAEREQGWK